jgi:molybdopterin adenylyltransferase
MVEVYALCVRPARGERLSLDQAALIAGKGLKGDRSSGGDRQVSLIAQEALEEAGSYGGLCTGRYSANIVTRGLDYAALKTGDILCIDDCIVGLSEMGKPCHQACPKIEEGCPLPGACAFGRVIRGGAVRVGSIVTLGGREESLE